MTTRQGALDMRSIETEGETIDRAIEKALRSLGVERDRVEIEILAAPSRGMFGFGGRPARIRAALRQPVSLESVGGETPSVSRGTSGARATAVGEPAPAEDRIAATAADVSIGPLGAKASGLLGGILDRLGVCCRIEARPGADPGVIQLDVMGDAGGLLIGRRGQTLDALEYLVNRIVTRNEDMTAGRIAIDVEGYRERRREYLDALARRLAQKAKETGSAVTLNPMSPRDRRIVHLALKSYAGVATRSEGEGHYRKLVILPAADGSHSRARPFTKST